MVVGKGGAKQRVEHPKGASLPALRANIGLGWKSLLGKNTSVL